jgi:spermidine/putrescine transport system permease protein
MIARQIDFARRGGLQAVLVAGIVFLYAPILVLIAFSFNESRRTVVWQGFTLDWYVEAFEDEALLEAALNSLFVAGGSTLLSTLLGILLGLALHRYRFPGKASLEGLVYLPIVVPEICLGVALLVFFAVLEVPLSLGTVIAGHVVFSFPFVAVIIRARMAGFDPVLEEASRDLGAGIWQTFRYVTLPHMLPGIAAGALIALTLSLDDFVVTFFTSGPGSTTLPIKIYSMVRFSVTPAVNAASTVLILLTALAAAGAMALNRRDAGRELP